MVRGVRPAHYTNGPVIIKPEFRTPRTRGFFSGWNPDDSAYGIKTWGYDSRARRPRQVRAAGRRLGRAGPRRPRDEADGRGAARDRQDHAGRALRAPDASAATSRATRPRWWPRSAGCARGLRRGGGGAVRELRPRAHLGDRLLGRVDAAHGRRAEHPRRVDHPAAARQHRSARRRHPGPARPRQHPGLDRHPDALQHPAGVHPDAPPAVAPDARQVRRAERAGHGRLGEPAPVHRLAAEGLVGRRRDRGERLLLPLPAAHQRRSLALRDDAEDARRRGEGHVLRRAEPDRRLGELEADAARAGQARLAGRA